MALQSSQAICFCRFFEVSVVVEERIDAAASNSEDRHSMAVGIAIEAPIEMILAS